MVQDNLALWFCCTEVEILLQQALIILNVFVGVHSLVGRTTLMAANTGMSNRYSARPL